MKKALSILLLVFLLSACSPATRPNNDGTDRQYSQTDSADLHFATRDDRHPDTGSGPDCHRRYPPAARTLAGMAGHPCCHRTRNRDLPDRPERWAWTQHAFSKAGDCQSVKAAFMGYLDLGQLSGHLQNQLSQPAGDDRSFQGPFQHGRPGSQGRFQRRFHPFAVMGRSARLPAG